MTEVHVEVVELPPKAADWASEFFTRFSDHEPQIADAMLVYLAEQYDIADIFTLDRRDFSIYRVGSKYPAELQQLCWTWFAR